MKTLEITNLPHPDPRILEFITDYKSDLEFENFYRNKVTSETYDNKLNMALSSQISLSSVFDVVKEQYQPYFNLPIRTSWFDILTNTNPEKGLACLPPHIHTIRTLAVNYFIELGGDNVKTSFYAHKPQTGIEVFVPQEKWGGYLKYDDVNLHSHIVTKKNTWHAYNTRIPHSVDDILGTRIFFTLVFSPMSEMADLLLEENIKYEVMPMILHR